MPYTKAKKSNVYKITNTQNGTVYIGSSIHPELRYSQHMNALRKNKHTRKNMQSDFNDSGKKEPKELFEIVVLYEDILILDINEIEEKTINYYRKNGTIYNSDIFTKNNCNNYNGFGIRVGGIHEKLF